MANSRVSKSQQYEFAIVNTAPSAAGYYTNYVGMKKRGLNKLFFSIRETADSGNFIATIRLEFRCPGDDDWTLYDTYNETTRKYIQGPGNAIWRAGVASGDFTSGEVKFGFDW